MTVADFRAPAPEDCHTSVAVDLDHAKFWDLVTDALVRIGERGPVRAPSSNGQGPSHEHLTHEPKTPANVAALMAALLAACVAFQLNASMLSPALVTMGKELHTDQAVIGLSQTWFFTAAALFSLFLPRLSDIVGRKKILVGMMVLMAVGSVIAALAPDVTWLFVGRIIQGVSGPTVPLCLIMLRSAVSNPQKYGTLMGLITAVNGGVAGVDSFVGGYFAEHYGFRSIFWLMVVLAVVATALIAVPRRRKQAGRRHHHGLARRVLHRGRGRRPAHRPQRRLQAGRRLLPRHPDAGHRPGRWLPSSPSSRSGRWKSAPSSPWWRPSTCASAPPGRRC